MFTYVMTSDKVINGMKASITDEVKNNLTFGSYEMYYGNQMTKISDNLNKKLENIKKKC